MKWTYFIKKEDPWHSPPTSWLDNPHMLSNAHLVSRNRRAVELYIPRGNDLKVVLIHPVDVLDCPYLPVQLLLLHIAHLLRESGTEMQFLYSMRHVVFFEGQAKKIRDGDERIAAAANVRDVSTRGNV